ncbi:hypothetical protein KEJ50_03000 [Candidatus Bathyarchaeota archaeon]|nr:hypothetical protein [Candidatus Bathyarchaeota archaeon]
MSKPLPPCLGKITGNTQPKNCFECRELFTVENGIIRYCEPIWKIKGYRLEWVTNRNQIYEYFKIEYEKLKFPRKCSAMACALENGILNSSISFF